MGGAVPGCLGSVFSMITGIVNVETVAEALVISALCTISGFFINRALKRVFR
jgi:hypothetical protein